MVLLHILDRFGTAAVPRNATFLGLLFVRVLVSVRTFSAVHLCMR